jgi:hypothetical protein
LLGQNLLVEFQLLYQRFDLLDPDIAADNQPETDGEPNRPARPRRRCSGTAKTASTTSP